MFIALIFPAQEQTIAYVSQCQCEGRDGSRLDDSISIKTVTDQTGMNSKMKVLMSRYIHNIGSYINTIYV